MKTDRQLRQDVMDELAWDPSINDTDIGVEVKDGVVTLEGHLSSYAEKYAAERAAQRVAGVKGVAVEIDVRLPGTSERSDADIVRASELALEWNVLVPKDKVKVLVEDGWVTLSGELERDYQRVAAGNAIRNLMGVIGVSNQISVKPAVLPSDVKVKIEAALQRRAHIETQRLTVLVNGDQVTLTGPVRSWSERYAALQAAAAASGVTRVVDKMVIA
ncbi:BON domain protein [Collimonas arenae]|uniref:BON domain protein n=1 Tax=Collimonas arenae TaxID=279058 RepID=A0A127QJ34_9BURK|nr:BON domain-containing protein [Collimonas arenae]AMP00124.1 BON domain protein [Collimonas arenae]AMP10024.1 BON domain protein [Collimonas arenae]